MTSLQQEILRDWLLLRIRHYASHGHFSPEFQGSSIGVYVKQAMDAYDEVEKLRGC